MNQERNSSLRYPRLRFEGMNSVSSLEQLNRQRSERERERTARFAADADAGLTAGFDEASEAIVLPLAGDEHLVKAASAGAQRFFDRVHAVENFHDAIVTSWRVSGLAGQQVSKSASQRAASRFIEYP